LVRVASPASLRKMCQHAATLPRLLETWRLFSI